MTATTDPRAKGLVDKSKVENLSSRDKKIVLINGYSFCMYCICFNRSCRITDSNTCKRTFNTEFFYKFHLQHHHKLGLKAH